MISIRERRVMLRIQAESRKERDDLQVVCKALGYDTWRIRRNEWRGHGLTLGVMVPHGDTEEQFFARVAAAGFPQSR